MKIIQELDFNEASNETLKLLENVKEMIFSSLVMGLSASIMLTKSILQKEKLSGLI